MKHHLLLGLLAFLVALSGCKTFNKKGTADIGATGEDGAAGTFQLPPFHQEKLGNGLRILVVEDDSLPVVTMSLLFETGTASDPAESAGLTSMMMDMLTKGTERRKAREIAEEIDFVGGVLSSGAGVDSSTVTVKVLKKDFAVGLDLLQDVVMRPTFPEDELSILKRQALGGVRFMFDNPGALAAYHSDYLVYGEEHPYGFVPSERSIRTITRERLVDHAKQNISPNNGWLMVAGDVKHDDVYRKLKVAFGTWETTRREGRRLPPLPKNTQKVRIVDKPDLTQSTILIAHPGPVRTSEERHAVRLMNYVLGGGGFSSRLMKAVRSEEGKTYGVSSSFDMNRRAGKFNVATSTRNAETTATVDLMLAELGKMREGGVTTSELEGAQGNFIGSFPLKLETVDAAAATLLNAIVYGLGADAVRNNRNNIAKQTSQTVNAAAKKHLRPDEAVIVVVGNAKEIAPDLQKRFGKVEIVPFLEPAHAVDRMAKKK